MFQSGPADRLLRLLARRPELRTVLDEIASEIEADPERRQDYAELVFAGEWGRVLPFEQPPSDDAYHDAETAEPLRREAVDDG